MSEHSKIKLTVAIKGSNRKTVKVWQSIAARDAAARLEKKNAIEKQMGVLTEKKKSLLALRQTTARLKEQLQTAHKHLAAGNAQQALSALLSISKDKAMEQHAQSLAFLCAMFYIYKHTGLTDKMLVTSETSLQQLTFSPEVYDIYYDIALCHHQYGDPGVARKIITMFIDNNELVYKDVAELYKTF